MELHDRLRQLREDKDLTQADLAAILSTSRQQVGKYETGRQEMTVGKLAILCRALGETLKIILEPSEEVQSLRRRVAELEGKLEEMRAQRDRAEYKYGCEVVINGELVDLCREHGLRVREALRSRPW